MNMNAKNEYSLISHGLNKYIRKTDKEMMKVFEYKLSKKDNFLAQIVLKVYGLSNKEMKNKLINMVNALQILNIVNDIEDDFVTSSCNDNRINKKYGEEVTFLASQYYYNVVLKIVYENYPETIGIIQKIIEQRISSKVLLNKLRYNSKITVPQYIEIVNKKWGTYFELSALISAYIAHLNKDKTKLIKEFANTVGIAYGIGRDLNDLQIHLKCGIITIPAIIMLTKTTDREKMIDELTKKEKCNFEVIYEEIVKTDSINEVKKIIYGYVEKGLCTINNIDGKQNLKKEVYEYFSSAIL